MHYKTEWYKTDLLGQLYVENVIVEGNEPVLFTCFDTTQQRYLIEMLDSYIGKYLIVPIQTNDLLDMLQDKITLEETFRKQSIAYFTAFNDDFDLVLEAVENSKIPSDSLPASGEYLELATLKIKEYIRQLSRISCESYSLSIGYYDNNKVSFQRAINIRITLQDDPDINCAYQKPLVKAFNESVSSISDFDDAEVMLPEVA